MIIIGFETAGIMKAIDFAQEYKVEIPSQD